MTAKARLDAELVRRGLARSRQHAQDLVARVRVMERTNVRSLTPDDIGGQVELVVADLSFISLSLVLPALVACARPDGDLLLMVKPQFEAGRDQVGNGGVVRDPQVWLAAVL